MALMLSIDQVADLAFAVGLRGDALVTAIAISHAESSFDMHARGDTTIQTSKWGPSIGLWQVRTLKAERGKGTARDELALYASGAHQARAMYEISGGGRNWRPWSVFTTTNPKHSYRRFLDSARHAARQREERGGTGSISGGGAPTPTSTVTGGASTPAADVDLGTSPDIVVKLGDLALNYTPPRQVERIRLEHGGKMVDSDVGDYVLGGSVEFTAGEASEVTLELHNPARRFIGSGSDIAKGSRFMWSGIEMRVVATELGQGVSQAVATVTARSEAVYQLKRPASEVGAALEAKRASPTEWLLRQLNARMGAVRFIGQGSPRRADIAPADLGNGDTETAWQMATRMAEELGYWLFEADGVVYFGKPSWLIRNTIDLKVAARPGAFGDERLDALELPTIRDSLDSDDGATCTVRLPRWRGEQVRPGMRLILRGVSGEAPGTWLVTRVSWPIDGGRAPVTVEAVEPVDPKPKDTAGVGAATPVGQAGSDAGPSGGGKPVVQTGGTASALDFTQLCLSQAGDTYIFGAEASASDPDPDAFDCSELVEWACARIGVKFTDGAYYQWKASRAISIEQAKATRGALLFVGSGRGVGRQAITHVAISLGDGRTTIEARGRKYGVGSWDIGNRFDFAGLIPALNYGTGLVRPTSTGVGAAGGGGAPIS